MYGLPPIPPPPPCVGHQGAGPALQWWWGGGGDIHGSPRGSRVGSPTSIDINMTSGGKTSASSLMVTRATDINAALGCIRTTTSLTALSSFRRHELQHGLRWRHLSLTSGWPLREQSPRASAASQTTYVHMDLRLHGILGQQHGPQSPTQSLQGPQWFFEEVQFSK